MSVLGANVLTLSDWAKRLDPDGKVPEIAEMLSQTNEVLLDMLWKEGNLPTGERTTVRTGLPSVAWRLINKGVQPSKSTTAQVDEACGTLEAWSEVDVKLADLNGNTSAFRLSEAQAFIEHEILGARLRECAEAVLSVEGKTAEEIFGFPDVLKLRSCVTLFSQVCEPGSVFERLLQKYYGGVADEATLRLLNGRK